jgi:hypothetical protein
LEKKEMNRFNMIRTTSEVLNENRPILAANAELLKKIDTFDILIDRIEVQDRDYQTISKGITSKKDSIKAELAKVIDCHCGELYNLGDDINDNNLMELSKVSVSALEKLPNTELLLKAQGTLQLLKNHTSALAAYDVNADDIAEFEALVKKYDDVLKIKDNKSDDSSIARDQLTATFSEAAKLLVKIDKAMKKAELKYPELHMKYLKARAISDLGVRHEAEIVEETAAPAAVA